MQKSLKVARSLSVLFVLVLFMTSMYPVLGAVQRAPSSRIVGTLYGFVTDLDGVAIQDARIEMSPAGAGLNKVAFSQAGLGYYTQALSEDTYTVSVTKLGYFPQETTIIIYGGESTRHDFSLEVVPPINCVLKGKITNNDTGFGVPNADMLMFDIIRSYNKTVSTTILGNFNISLYAGDFIMFVGKSGFLPKLLGGIHIDSGETKTLDFKLYPMPALDARITGDVTYKLNNGTTGPVPYAHITIYDQERSFYEDAEADGNGHIDLNLYRAKFVFMVSANNMTILDSIPRNITALSSQVVVQNFKLTELPPGKTITNLDITKWDKQIITMNSTTLGRSTDGNNGPTRNMRFQFDLFFGNGDMDLTPAEAKPYTDLFERDIRNNFGFYDTHNLFKVDSMDFIFDKDVISAFIDMSGNVFGNKPMIMNVVVGATPNGTINDKLPVHHIWLNQTYATDDGSENITLHFPNIFTFKNMSASEAISVQYLGNGTLKMVPGKNPDPKSDNRTELITYDLVENIPPVAKAGPDKIINEDVDTIFDGSGSSDNFGILYYVWDFGDGTIKNATIPTQAHNYPNPGKYNVTLTVIDVVHLKAIAKINVTVKDVTPPTVKIEVANTTVDEDTMVHFKANATDNVGVANISWAVDGKPRVNGTNFDTLFANPGKYSVSVNVTDGAGLKAEAVVDITVRDTTPPVANPGKNRTVNESDEVKFDGTGSSDNVGIVKYSWNFGDGSTNITGGTTSHIYNKPGNYTVLLNVTDAVGHWNQKSLWVLVKDISPPVATAQASNTTIRKNKSIDFNSTGSHDNVGIVSYSWEFGDGTTAEGPTATHQYKKAGIYTVNLTVKDAAGLTDKKSITITVKNPVVQSNPYLSAVCIGSLFAIVFFGGIGAYLVYRRVKLGGYKIEEAFVIYRDGRLIKHISTHPTENSDKEIIASMLTAVQDFVKDSLKKKEGEFLGKLEFGKKTKILIERGDKIYLAIVMSGHDPDSLRTTLAKTVKQVENKYEKRLEKWDGDTSAFQGLDEMVIELVEG
jgi:PKD repeat protein